MANEMISRVVKAIRNCVNDPATKDGMYFLAKTSSQEHVENWLNERMARVAIAAMKNPTYSVLAKGIDALGWDGAFANAKLDKAYDAMLSEIIHGN